MNLVPDELIIFISATLSDRDFVNWASTSRRFRQALRYEPQLMISRLTRQFSDYCASPMIPTSDPTKSQYPIVREILPQRMVQLLSLAMSLHSRRTLRMIGQLHFNRTKFLSLIQGLIDGRFPELLIPSPERKIITDRLVAIRQWSIELWGTVLEDSSIPYYGVVNNPLINWALKTDQSTWLLEYFRAYSCLIPHQVDPKHHGLYQYCLSFDRLVEWVFPLISDDQFDQWKDLIPDDPSSAGIVIQKTLKHGRPKIILRLLDHFTKFADDDAFQARISMGLSRALAFRIATEGTKELIKFFYARVTNEQLVDGIISAIEEHYWDTLQFLSELIPELVMKNLMINEVYYLDLGGIKYLATSPFKRLINQRSTMHLLEATIDCTDRQDDRIQVFSYIWETFELNEQNRTLMIEYVADSVADQLDDMIGDDDDEDFRYTQIETIYQAIK